MYLSFILNAAQNLNINTLTSHVWIFNVSLHTESFKMLLTYYLTLTSNILWKYISVNCVSWLYNERACIYTMFIVQAYQTFQYVLPPGGIFLSKWHSSSEGSSGGEMTVQSACTLNTRYVTVFWDVTTCRWSRCAYVWKELAAPILLPWRCSQRI
jgi:hypothetical protein